ncbi:MAG: aldo/keto reductase [Euryarchaeota archaeon RBG_19FT_COMBO_56_21]|nr:MAG: aldo/keto reductase [Euryarchaeota archaeon RBG_19FT_COMBO_56_21]
MEYRKFGKLDWKASALGFGCMRLPTKDGKPMSGRIDQEKATRMIRNAIDHGVNYIDTAYPYHHGKSEAFVGRVLTSGYRERVKLATKSPVWLIKKPKHFDKYLDEQLARLRTDRIDFYLFHALNKKVWEKTIVKHKLLDRAERAREDGKIVHLGFSFHDDFAAFKKIVDGHDRWDICQIQYNYMDTENQAGTKGLRYAASKSLGVVIMEPLLGGRLANPPRTIMEIMKSDRKMRSPADLALQWIWNQPEVSLVLSGMNTLGQVRGNIRSASASGVRSFGALDLKLIDRIKKKYREMVPIPCTECSYCMPCPNGVDIPRNFEVYNNGYIHEDMRTARNTYERFVPKKNRASACAQCKRCERKCPQKIPISEWMPRVHAILSGGRISS